MSYSFNVRAATAAAAIIAVRAELDKVVEAQPIHAADMEHAAAAAEAFIGLVRTPGDDEELSVSVNGSVTKPYSGVEGDELVSASVGVSATVLAKT